MTKILLGYEATTANSASRKEIYADFDRLVNPHVMICGDTGTGKTHTIRRCINEAIRTSTKDLRIHVFDVHGDINIDPKICSEIEFSEASEYGFNPLKINPDPRYGGVRKCIQNFISTLRLSSTTSRALGPKQQDVLRNLLTDVFEQAGFFAEDPSTWHTSAEEPPEGLIGGRIYIDLPFHDREVAKKLVDGTTADLAWHGAVKCWHVAVYDGPITRWPVKAWSRINPTLRTLVAYATRRREMSFTGLGQKEAALMEVVHKRAKALNSRLQQRAKTRNNDNGAFENEEADKELDKAKADCLNAFKDYFATVEQGNAIDSLLKYDSFESLSTVKQILDSLLASGIFRDTQPRFDPRKPVWRYNIKALSAEEQKFLVNFRLREIFAHAVQEGEQDKVVEIAVIDEGAKFVEDDDDHIVNVIAMEARKFGLGIWFLSQSPTQFPEILLSSVATKLILGLDANYWPVAQRRLRIEERAMKWIRPREGMLANFKLAGQSAQNWVWVTTPDPSAAR